MPSLLRIVSTMKDDGPLHMRWPLFFRQQCKSNHFLDPCIIISRSDLWQKGLWRVIILNFSCEADTFCSLGMAQPIAGSRSRAACSNVAGLRLKVVKAQTKTPARIVSYSTSAISLTSLTFTQPPSRRLFSFFNSFVHEYMK